MNRPSLSLALLLTASAVLPSACRKDGASAEIPGQTGTLSLEVLPPVKVMLDGRDIGQTPLKDVVVPGGQHALRLWRDDDCKVDASRPVKIIPGEKFEARFMLRPTEFSGNCMPRGIPAPAGVPGPAGAPAPAAAPAGNAAPAAEPAPAAR